MHVRIYQPAKTAMQSGKARTKKWRMTFEESAPKFVEPLMGWVGMRDTTQQLDLAFSSKEEAIAYAQKKGYDFRVIEPNQRQVTPKSYADNFSFYKIKA